MCTRSMRAALHLSHARPLQNSENEPGGVWRGISMVVEVSKVCQHQHARAHSKGVRTDLDVLRIRTSFM